MTTEDPRGSSELVDLVARCRILTLRAEALREMMVQARRERDDIIVTLTDKHKLSLRAVSEQVDVPDLTPSRVHHALINGRGQRARKEKRC